MKLDGLLAYPVGDVGLAVALVPINGELKGRSVALFICWLDLDLVCVELPCVPLHEILKGDLRDLVVVLKGSALHNLLCVPKEGLASRIH